ncbi:MAG TPA: uroporphyrinogen-III synthase, partial [Acidobacteriaceae bacterium]|nr:uroporphyrinogen-III synthase [Acidobacteriaceae bacterium]
MTLPLPSRVLVTRSPHQSSELADHLRALSLHPILLPSISLAVPSSFAPLDAALAHLDRFHWLLFTSANAVEA